MKRDDSSKDMSTDTLLAVLKQHNIPVYSNVVDLGFLLSPHGIPYIPLPAPHDAYCLTTYLPLVNVLGGENDAEVLTRIMNTTEGQDGLGRTKYREITLEASVAFVEHQLSSPPEGWSTGVIRQISQVETTPYPTLVGNAVMKRARHDPLDSEDELYWTNKEKDAPDQEVHWNIAALVDPACGGKGLAVAALRYIMERWYIPTIQTFPGQLVSEYFATNARSRRMHEKLGFKPMAISRRIALEPDKLLPKWRDRTDELDLVCCVWQGFHGEWAVEKEGTVFRNLPLCGP